MAISETEVRDALSAVKYPGFSRDIVSFGLVKGIRIADGDVTVQLALATNDPSIPQTIKTDAEKTLRGSQRRAKRKGLDRHSRAAGGNRHGNSWRDPPSWHQTRHCDRERQRRRRQIYGRGESRSRACKKPERVSASAIATFTGQAFLSCSARANDRWRRKTIASSRSSNTTCA